MLSKGKASAPVTEARDHLNTSGGQLDHKKSAVIVEWILLKGFGLSDGLPRVLLKQKAEAILDYHKGPQDKDAQLRLQKFIRSLTEVAKLPFYLTPDEIEDLDEKTIKKWTKQWSFNHITRKVIDHRKIDGQWAGIEGQREHVRTIIATGGKVGEFQGGCPVRWVRDLDVQAITDRRLIGELTTKQLRDFLHLNRIVARNTFHPFNNEKTTSNRAPLIKIAQNIFDRLHLQEVFYIRDSALRYLETIPARGIHQTSEALANLEQISHTYLRAKSSEGSFDGGSITHV